MRTIQAPGVEWTEVDKSGYGATEPDRTGCLIVGFANKGEPYNYHEFKSCAAWSDYYGTPNNEAERYFYAAACECLNQGGKLFTARLPYDNDSMNLIAGIKYVVNTVGVLVSDYVPEIQKVDSELSIAALISADSHPTMYSLDKIEEYRGELDKVPSDTFLIVDTTFATYSKVTEDTRTGKNRELIGIVPVVTTAPNAMYALNLLSLPYNKVSAYETIDGSALKTLNNGNAGLSSSDVVVRFNTQGYYDQVTKDFTTCGIRTLGTYNTNVKTAHDLYNEIVSFANDYSYAITGEYSLATFRGIVDFYNNLPNLIDTTIVPSAKVTDVTEKLSDYINNVKGTVIWYYAEDDGSASTEAVETAMSTLTATYNTYKDKIAFATTDYVNPDSMMWTTDAAGNTYQTATLAEGIDKSVPEWHALNGDDSIPNTLSLDANYYFPVIQPANDGVGLDPEYLKDIGVVVYKMYMNASEGNKISYELVESFSGSLCKDDVDPNTSKSKFIDTIINSLSKYINFFSNCFNRTAVNTWYKTTCDTLITPPTPTACLGFFSEMTNDIISIDKSIYEGLEKVFEKAKDLNKLYFRVVCDTGLANIASYIKAIYGNKGRYDLNVTDALGNSRLSMWTCKKAIQPCVLTWKSVELKFDNFCKNVRKDCMFIADGLRPLVLQGQAKKIRDTNNTNTITNSILPYFPAICGLNTNYGAGYCDWFLTTDQYSGNLFWCPPSIKAMGVYINTDMNFNYWDAPAGLNRGKIDASDVAFSPTVAEAGNFYQKNWNYAINYPDTGIVLEGQKTFLVKPSALDRVNVRRLFLRLERYAYDISKFFVYEGNTAYTRQRLVDALDPVFNAAKVGGGIQDYKIVCDETNNTDETIDNNELHVSIGIKPTKTIEFIVFNFIAGRNSQSWEEIMG